MLKEMPRVNAFTQEFRHKGNMISLVFGNSHLGSRLENGLGESKSEGRTPPRVQVLGRGYGSEC